MCRYPPPPPLCNVPPPQLGLILTDDNPPSPRDLPPVCSLPLPLRFAHPRAGFAPPPTIRPTPLSDSPLTPLGVGIFQHLVQFLSKMKRHKIHCSIVIPLCRLMENMLCCVALRCGALCCVVLICLVVWGVTLCCAVLYPHFYFLYFFGSYSDSDCLRLLLGLSQYINVGAARITLCPIHHLPDVSSTLSFAPTRPQVPSAPFKGALVHKHGAC